MNSVVVKSQNVKPTLSDDDRAELLRLMAIIRQSDGDKDIPIVFTKEQADVLLEIIVWWMGFKAIGQFTPIVTTGLRLCAYGAGLYLAWRAGVLPGFLTNLFTGQK